MTLKLKILIGINVILVLALMASLYSPENQTSIKYKAIFSLQDSSQIDRFEVNADKIALKSPNTWLLNNQVRVQSTIMRGIFTILQKIEVKSELNGEAKRRTLEALDKQGITFKAISSNREVLNFRFATFEGENVATLDGKQVFSVYVPGLMVDLQRFFTVSPQSWRENTLFETSAQSLKFITVSYPHSKENSFTLLWDSTFFKVEGVTTLDSMALWNYVQYLPRVKGLRFVESPSLSDSIAKAKAFAEIVMQDIRAVAPTKLKVYSLPTRLVALNQNNEVIELDFRDFNPKAKISVLVNKNYFQSKK